MSICQPPSPHAPLGRIKAFGIIYHYYLTNYRSIINLRFTFDRKIIIQLRVQWISLLALLCIVSLLIIYKWVYEQNSHLASIVRTCIQEDRRIPMMSRPWQIHETCIMLFWQSVRVYIIQIKYENNIHSPLPSCTRKVFSGSGFMYWRLSEHLPRQSQNTPLPT